MFVDKIFERATIRGKQIICCLEWDRIKIIGVMRNDWMNHI